MLTANEYVEARSGGYYAAGTRIGLDIIAHDFRNGRSAERIARSKGGEVVLDEPRFP